MDDLHIKRPEDPTKINIHEDWELNYWSRELHITKDELIEIVKKVGVSISDVKEELQRRHSHSKGDYSRSR
jgi:hypothetical protein